MFKLYLLFATTKKYFMLIFIQSLNYAYELIFPAFGPVLNRVSSEKDSLIYSSWSLLFLIVSFLIKPMNFEYKKKYFFILVFINSFATISFSLVSFVPKLAILALSGFTVGRIAVFWSRLFLKEVPKQTRGQVICIILFVSYGILYLANLFVLLLPAFIATLLPAFLLVSSILLFHFNKVLPQLETVDEALPLDEKHHFPWMFFLIIAIIYITAGITYASVYPQLLSYRLLERYYNVLPFMLTVPFAGLVADLKGRKYLIYIGLSFLGLSFIFFTFKESPLTYFLTQSTLQPGWAFLDAYVWIAAADLAILKKRPSIHVYGVVAFLTGTNIGSIISIMLSNTKMVYSPYYALFTYLPLFIVIAFLHLIPETLSVNERNFSMMSNNTNLLDQLTAREKEIVELFYRDIDNKEIAATLFISYNTLKTHIRNINRKLGISNKKELKEYFTRKNDQCKL